MYSSGTDRLIYKQHRTTQEYRNYGISMSYVPCTADSSFLKSFLISFDVFTLVSCIIAFRHDLPFCLNSSSFWIFFFELFGSISKLSGEPDFVLIRSNSPSSVSCFMFNFVAYKQENMPQFWSSELWQCHLIGGHQGSSTLLVTG
jgi:hypothetical protein